MCLCPIFNFTGHVILQFLGKVITSHSVCFTGDGLTHSHCTREVEINKPSNPCRQNLLKNNYNLSKKVDVHTNSLHFAWFKSVLSSYHI